MLHYRSSNSCTQLLEDIIAFFSEWIPLLFRNSLLFQQIFFMCHWPNSLSYDWVGAILKWTAQLMSNFRQIAVITSMILQHVFLRKPDEYRKPRCCFIVPSADLNSLVPVMMLAGPPSGFRLLFRTRWIGHTAYLKIAMPKFNGLLMSTF